MSTVTFAASDVSGLFWLVVIVVTVIAQIVKAKQQFNKSRPGQVRAPTAEPDRMPEADRTPEEELREFLRSLTGAPPARRPAPMVVPAPPPAARPAPKRRAVATPRRVAAPPPLAPPTQAPVQASVWENVVNHDNAYAETRMDRSESTGKRKAVLAAMKDGRSLRQAFLLRTILGPPVTLR